MIAIRGCPSFRPSHPNWPRRSCVDRAKETCSPDRPEGPPAPAAEPLRRGMLGGTPRSQDNVRSADCIRRVIFPMMSGDSHSPACQWVRLSWPGILSGRLSFVTWGETGSVAALSKRRLTRQAIRADTLTVDKRLATTPYSWARALLTCTSFTERPSCST